MLQTIKQLALSVDEIALSFSLINHADVGKSILQSTYGNISTQSLEDKLTSASHSLLARGIARISEKGVVTLDEKTELLLYPLIKFKNIIQVSINDGQNQSPEITNVYIGMNNVFTALRITSAVVYHLFYSETKDIPDLINSWLDLHQKVDSLNVSGSVGSPLKMSEIARAISGDSKNLGQVLHKSNLSDSIAKELESDLRNPKKRGTVVLTEMNSENYAQKNTSESGAGFLFLSGNKLNWVFKFNKADEQTLAQIVVGSEPLVLDAIENLVGRA